jgi:branched-chain amino acid transport system ATP-binding protein
VSVNPTWQGQSAPASRPQAGWHRILDIKGLSASYAKTQVLRDVDLHVNAGEIVALLGRNGSGRSTLAKSIVGLTQAWGHMALGGTSLIGLRPFRIARLGVGFVAETRDVFADLSVAENLELGVRPTPRQGTAWSFRWSRTDVVGAFPRLGERMDAPAGALSGGEQQMLVLNRALLGQPRLLIVDEPTEGLSPMMVAKVAGLLLKAREQGLSILLIEQKLAIALDVADRVYVLGHGHVVFEGSPQQLKFAAHVQREWLSV